MRILVTRPAADSSLLAQLLTDAGHVAIVSPMLEIKPAPFQMPSDKAQALVFTSRHAVAPAAAAPGALALPAFCIGPATADAATAAGFNVVAQADGSRGALVAQIAAHRPKHIVFISGADERGDIVSELAAAKVRATRCVVYRATAATSFSDAAQQLLSANQVDMALLFSARSAATFAKLVDALPGFDRSQLQLGCLSEAVQASAGGNWATVCIPPTPSLNDLLECAGLVCDSAAWTVPRPQ